MVRLEKTVRSGGAWSIGEVGISELLVFKNVRKCREYVKSLALLMLAIYVNTLENIMVGFGWPLCIFSYTPFLVDSLFF